MLRWHRSSPNLTASSFTRHALSCLLLIWPVVKPLWRAAFLLWYTDLTLWYAVLPFGMPSPLIFCPQSPPFLACVLSELLASLPPWPSHMQPSHSCMIISPPDVLPSFLRSQALPSGMLPFSSGMLSTYNCMMPLPTASYEDKGGTLLLRSVALVYHERLVAHCL